MSSLLIFIFLFECRFLYIGISVNCAGAGFLYHPDPAVVLPVAQVHPWLGGPFQGKWRKS
jgi:hypothetical protein